MRINEYVTSQYIIIIFLPKTSQYINYMYTALKKTRTNSHLQGAFTAKIIKLILRFIGPWRKLNCIYMKIPLHFVRRREHICLGFIGKKIVPTRYICL